jgi:hypothetical protein
MRRDAEEEKRRTTDTHVADKHIGAEMDEGGEEEEMEEEEEEMETEEEEAPEVEPIHFRHGERCL